MLSPLSAVIFVAGVQSVRRPRSRAEAAARAALSGARPDYGRYHTIAIVHTRLGDFRAVAAENARVRTINADWRRFGPRPVFPLYREVAPLNSAVASGLS